MRKLQPEDIVDIASYELERIKFRHHVIEEKKNRRVQVGNLITLVFENLLTVRFQVQEMMRAERIVLPDRIKEEIKIYNELLPARDELSATLFIEVSEQSLVKKVLDEMWGLDQAGTTSITIDGQEIIPGVYEGGHSHESKISAVHHVVFPFTVKQVKMFKNADTDARLLISHGIYEHEALLSGETRRSLIQDLL